MDERERNIEEFDPEVTPSDRLGSERWSWKGAAAFSALFMVSVLGGTFAVQYGIDELLKNTSTLSEFSRGQVASMASVFGYGAGFLGSMEVAGKLGWVPRPHWERITPLFDMRENWRILRGSPS